MVTCTERAQNGWRPCKVVPPLRKARSVFRVDTPPPPLRPAILKRRANAAQALTLDGHSGSEHISSKGNDPNTHRQEQVQTTCGCHQRGEGAAGLPCAMPGAPGRWGSLAPSARHSSAGDGDIPVLRAVADPGTRLPKLTLPAEGPSASVSSPSVAGRGRQQEDVEKCERAVSLWKDVRPREINS